MSNTTVQLGPDSTLAEVILARPGAERVLERFGLDYCCGGARPLRDATAPLGLDPDEVLVAVEAVEVDPIPEWNGLAPAELTVHIEDVHHAYLHEELPRLNTLALRVAGVHGGHHPELREIARVYGKLRDELEPHLRLEEETVFPMIRRLAAGEPLDTDRTEAPITALMAEHDDAGALLERLRSLTDGYRTPADGCASYHALFDGLAQLEADTHLHVHIENNILFPAVAALEARRT